MNAKSASPIRVLFATETHTHDEHGVYIRAYNYELIIVANMSRRTEVEVENFALSFAHSRVCDEMIVPESVDLSTMAKPFFRSGVTFDGHDFFKVFVTVKV